MKCVILAGGTGSRLMPLTKVINKHLVGVAGRPMIEYILDKVKETGIKDVFIVTGLEHLDTMVRYLQDGSEYGMRFNYGVQVKPGGIGEALQLAETWAGTDDLFVMLGDNVFIEHNFSTDIESFSGGAKVFLKEVTDPTRFGVAELENGLVKSIEEKPQNPKSSYAVVGAYIYDNSIFDKLKNIGYSGRGEKEISHVNQIYIEQNNLSYSMVNGFWSDAGTHQSLKQCTNYIYEHNRE